MDQLSDNLRDDAAVFVLGAMSELEREAFRVNMMRNCDLGRYVESLERVGDALLTSAPAATVPDSIGASILAEAQRELDAREILQSPRGAPAMQHRGSGARVFRPLALALSVLVVGIGAFAIGGGFDSAPPSTQPLAAEFVAPDVPTMSGEIEATDDGAAVALSGMESDLNGDVYQLWVLHDEKVYPAPVFSVNSDGDGHAFIDRELVAGDVVMITREPTGGSKQQTGEPLAEAKI